MEKLTAILAELGAKVDRLVVERDFDSKVPLSLREAAEVCHVELTWLRERVARKEIPAYRHREGTPWKVFPKDIRAYLMAETNVVAVRRKSVLRLTRSGNGR